MKPEYKNLIKDLLFEQDQVDIVVLKIKRFEDLDVWKESQRLVIMI